jgi:hypothetical protein
MKRYEATKYQSYARECLRQAEAADTPERREKLLELSRIWMEAALHEEMHHLSRGQQSSLMAEPSRSLARSE